MNAMRMMARILRQDREGCLISHHYKCTRVCIRQRWDESNTADERVRGRYCAWLIEMVQFGSCDWVEWGGDERATGTELLEEQWEKRSKVRGCCVWKICSLTSINHSQICAHIQSVRPVYVIVARKLIFDSIWGHFNAPCCHNTSPTHSVRYSRI